MENPKKYPDFDFKPLKNTQIAILRAVLGKNGLHFPKIFQKTLKNTKIRILYPKKYDEHIYHLTMEVPSRVLNTFYYFWCFVELFIVKFHVQDYFCPWGTLRSVQMEESYLGQAGYPMSYNR